MEYASAAASAREAYSLVLEAAVQLGIRIEPQAWQADYKAKGMDGKFVDGVDYPRFRP
jgi:hypothetical protein